MKFLYPFLLLFVFISCSEDEKFNDNNVILSDNDISMVASINLIEIINKMGVSESELPVDQKMMFNTAMSTIDGKSLGFKIEGNHKFFFVPETSEQNGAVFLVGEIINKATFEKTIKSTLDVSVKDKEEINFMYSELNELKLTIANNAENFIAGISLNNDFTEQKIMSYFENSNSEEKTDLSLKKYLEREDDFSYYISSKKIFSALKAMNLTGLNLDEMPVNFVESFFALNFNKGNISFETEILNFESETGAKMNITGNGLDEKFTTFLTDNNKLIGFVMANLNTSSIASQLKDMKTKEILEINDELRNYGITISDIVEMFDGQFSLSLIDMDYKPSDKIEDLDYDDWNDMQWEDNFEESNNVESIPDLILNFGLSNQSKFIELINKNASIKEGLIYSDRDLNVLVKENVVHFSTKLELLQKININGSLGKFSLVNKDLINKAVYGELTTDINHFPNKLLTSLRSENISIDELFEEINKISFNLSDTKSNLIIDFSDKTKNSLAKMFEMIYKRLAFMV
tara:strand:- start:7153 stop:8706 length:1554 start_codon:yes stop_codon:yes gene_type:complete